MPVIIESLPQDYTINLSFVSYLNTTLSVTSKMLFLNLISKNESFAQISVAKLFIGTLDHYYFIPLFFSALYSWMSTDLLSSILLTGFSFNDNE